MHVGGKDKAHMENHLLPVPQVIHWNTREKFSATHTAIFTAGVTAP